MIKRVTAAALCILAMLGSPAAANEYGQVFSELDRTVREKFYDPHFGGRDWPAIAARYRSQLDQVSTDAEFQKLGQSMLNELGVSHVVVHLPGENRPTMGLAARWEMIDDVPVIVDIDPASAARAAGLRTGDRILNPSAIRGPRQEPAQLQVERCDGTIESLNIPRESAYWPPRQRTIPGACCDGATVGPLAIFAPTVLVMTLPG